MRSPAPAVVLVEGTWGGAWAQPFSPFCRMLRANGLEPVRFHSWTLNLDGVPLRLWQRGKHRNWIAGGYGLADRIRVVRAMAPSAPVRVIAHSHALNVVLYALVRNEDIRIDRLISICSPVRRDMRNQAKGAVKRIGRWRHVSASDGDWWQKLGALFDGRFGWGERKWTIADAPNVENVSIHGIGHTRLLDDPAFLDLWKTDGMIDFLRSAEVLGV